MKRKHLTLAAVMAALLGFGAAPVKALPGSQVNAIKQAVAQASVLELAPVAAELVKSADKKDREDVAVAVVRLVLEKNQALALSLVEQIAKVAPETAPAVAAAAAELAPAQLE